MENKIEVIFFNGAKTVDIEPLLKLDYYKTLFSDIFESVQHTLDLKEYIISKKDFKIFYNWLSSYNFDIPDTVSFQRDAVSSFMMTYLDLIQATELFSDENIFKAYLTKKDRIRIETEYILREDYAYEHPITNNILLTNGELKFFSDDCPYLNIGNQFEMFRMDTDYRKKISELSGDNNINISNILSSFNKILKIKYDNLSFKMIDRVIETPYVLNFNNKHNMENIVKKYFLKYNIPYDSIDWNIMMLAGGSVVDLLLNKVTYLSDVETRIKDFDFFLITDNPKLVMKQLRKLAEHFNGNIIRSKYAITFQNEGYIPLSIILRLYQDRQQVLTGFDIDASCVGFDGINLIYTPRFLNSINTMTNIVDPERQSKTYAYRLHKYMKKGFALALPGIKNYNDITWLKEEQKLEELNGLQKVIYLNMFTTYKEDAYVSDYGMYDEIENNSNEHQQTRLNFGVVNANSEKLKELISKEQSIHIGWNYKKKTLYNLEFVKKIRNINNIHISTDIENIININSGSSEIQIFVDHPYNEFNESDDEDIENFVNPNYLLLTLIEPNTEISENFSIIHNFYTLIRKKNIFFSRYMVVPLKYKVNNDGIRKYKNLTDDFPSVIEFISHLPHSQVSGSFCPTSEKWYQGFLY